MQFCTWYSWVVCPPAYNHTSKNFCTFRGFQKSFSLKKTSQVEGTRRDWTVKRLVKGPLKLRVFPNVTQSKKTTNELRHINHFMWPRLNLPSFFPCRNFFAEKVLIPLLGSGTEKRNLTFIHRITLGKAQEVNNTIITNYTETLSVLRLIITACYKYCYFRQ